MWFGFVMSDCQRDSRLGLSRRTNLGMSWFVRHVSWLVEHMCGAQRRWSTMKVKVRRVCVDELEAEKDECWDLTEGSKKLGDQPRWLAPRDIDKRRCTWRSDCID